MDNIRAYAKTVWPIIAALANILVIDDDQDLRQALKLVLQRDGHDVREAANGVEGLQRVREHLPEVILLDAKMPVLDGGGFLEARSSQPNLAAVPVVLLSGLLVESAALSSKFPGVRYLAKPFKIAQLKAVLAEAMAASKERPTRSSLAGEPAELGLQFAEDLADR